MADNTARAHRGQVTVESNDEVASKRLKTSRPLVDSVHLSVLVASYRKRFEEYSRTHYRSSQIIPSKVWKLVYEDYTNEIPDSSFNQETLKMRLRSKLSALCTGTSDPVDDRASLQSDEVLEELKKRNMLMMRESVLQGESLSGDVFEESQDVVSDESNPVETKKENLSKQDVLKQQLATLSAVASMVDTIKEQSAMSNEYKMLKIELMKLEKEQKEEYFQAKLTKIKNENFKFELEKLKQLKDIGAISEKEFIGRARSLAEF